jgi:hypothetical protein
VSEREQEYAGDYGYDLVHEEVKRQRAAGPADRQDDRRPDGPTTGSGGEPAPDLGYDEAHGF